MGCDVHMYPEYKRYPDSNRWNSLTGHWNPGRDYALFGILAGVRGDGPPIVNPRGVPADMGWNARDDYLRWVADGEAPEGDCRISRRLADTWVKDGCSQWAEGPHEAKHGGVGYVTDPNAHTPTWLSLDEFREALRRRKDEFDYPMDDEYGALLAALAAMSEAGYPVRVVLWFDN